MSKAVKTNIDHLKRLAKSVKGDNKSKADKLIQLHYDRKTSSSI